MGIIHTPMTTAAALRRIRHEIDGRLVQQVRCGAVAFTVTPGRRPGWITHVAQDVTATHSWTTGCRLTVAGVGTGSDDVVRVNMDIGDVPDVKWGG